MAQTKSQLWTSAQEIIAKIPTTKKLTETDLESLTMELAALYAPKNKTAANPSYEEDGINYHWCKYHNQYESDTAMVLDKDGNGKGYCKAAASLSNARRQEWRDANDKMATLMIAGEIEAAQEIAATQMELKDSINNPSYFDYDSDWERFLNPPKAEDDEEDSE